MADIVNTLNYSKTPLCPWCGKVVWSGQGNIDHVIPVYEWKHIRNSRTYALSGYGVCVTVNDTRNRVIAHRWCNASKSCQVLIPTWNVNGPFRFWEIRLLFEHATYVYYWSDLLLRYYNRLLELNISSAWCREYFGDLIVSINIFRLDYERRLASGNWYIDEV